MTASTPSPSIVMIGTAPSNQGGIASVVQSYASAGLLDRWRVRYLTTHTDGPHWRKAWLMVRALAAFAPLLRRPPSFLHVHIASRASFWRKLVFIALARSRAIPVLLHVHGGAFVTFHDGGGALRRRVIRWVFECAAAVIALTPSWAAWLRTIAPRATVMVVPNPVQVPALAAPPPRDDGSVLFLGRLTFNKGLDVLIESFARVAARHRRATLWLGGTGDVDAVQADLARRGLSERVRLLGWVDGPAKAALLERADIFALPSRVEGLPVGMLEAMAYGVPVVVSRVGGVPDAVTDGVEGFVVPAGDADAFTRALDALLADPARRRAMGAAGRNRALAEFDLPVVTARVEQIYADLVRRGAR